MKAPVALAVLVLQVLILAGRASAQADLFSVSLELQTNATCIGQPLRVWADITYNGDKTLRVYDPIYGRGYEERVAISRGSEESYKPYYTAAELVAARQDRGGAPKQVVFEPGQSLRREYRLWCWNHPEAGRSWLIFPSPGVYKIRFQVIHLNQVYSAITTNDVVLPSSETDIEAWGLIGDDTTAYFMQNGQAPRGQESRNGEIVTRLRRLATEHPSSSYVQYLSGPTPGTE